MPRWKGLQAGVASAMSAAAHVCEHGIGVAASAAAAAAWYRKAIGASARQPEETSEEAEEEGERLPGGNASEHHVLSNLARLYASGGGDLTPDARLSRQFEYLARAAARRSREGTTSSSEDDEAQVV